MNYERNRQLFFIVFCMIAFGLMIFLHKMIIEPLSPNELKQLIKESPYADCLKNHIQQADKPLSHWNMMTIEKTCKNKDAYLNQIKEINQK